MDILNEISNTLIMGKKRRNGVSKGVCMISSATNQALVQPWPFVLLIFGCSSVSNENIPSSSNIERALVTCKAEPKEVHKCKVIMEVTVGVTDHVKWHHIINNVWSQHMQATAVHMKDLFLEICQWKMNTGV